MKLHCVCDEAKQELVQFDFGWQTVALFLKQGLALPKSFMEALYQKGKVLNAMDGGIVFGRTHEEGGILMMQRCKCGGQYYAAGEMESGEYLIPVASLKIPEQELLDLNHRVAVDSSFVPRLTIATCPPEVTRRLDARDKPFDKLLWLGSGSFIILNHQATAVCWKEIETYF